MAEFLTTTGTSAQIEQIIIKAKKYLIICSPFLKISKTFYERLIDADSKDVSITIIYGKSELTNSEEEKLTDLKNLELYYLENLHAKCYANENTMIITSMNFYEYSLHNNREMGILIRRADDNELYSDGIDELRSIRNAAESFNFNAWGQRISDDRNYKKQKRKNATEYGYCIRCKESIPVNANYPLCRECYEIWSIFSNCEYEENFCHFCGKESKVYYDRPLCYQCFVHGRETNLRSME